MLWLLLCQILQVLALPGLVWKQLTGEAVSWSKDFPAVDSVLVRTFKLPCQVHFSPLTEEGALQTEYHRCTAL